MTAYVYPTSTTGVSDDFQDHVDRGSVNPGTDYTAAYGSNVVAVAAGTVTDASNDPGGGGGRTVHIDHDDGTGSDYLHLSAVGCSAGQWVPQGALIGISGASGYGSDWYYGPHLHISYRPNHAHGYGNSGNQDFDAIMTAQGGQPTPPEPTPIIEEEEEIMTVGQVHYTNASGQVIRSLYVPGTAYWLPYQANTADIANGFANSLETGPSVQVTESLFNAMARAASALLVPTPTPPTADPPPEQSTRSISPAQWVIGGAGLLLLLLALVVVPILIATVPHIDTADLASLEKFLIAGGLAFLGVAVGTLTRNRRASRHATDDASTS